MCECVCGKKTPGEANRKRPRQDCSKTTLDRERKQDLEQAQARREEGERDKERKRKTHGKSEGAKSSLTERKVKNGRFEGRKVEATLRL